MPESKPASFNVLFVEDDAGYANILKRRLLDTDNPPFHIRHVQRLGPALDLLAAGNMDVILLDLSLPDSQGLNTLIRVHERAPEVPVVISTGLDDEFTGIEAVRYGAEDYLVKGHVNGKAVSRVLRYAIERHRQRLELEHLSLSDELTGLYNRRGFLALAEQQLKLAPRTDMGFLLFYIDLDHFKQINDTYGHAEGDRVLKDFADILRGVFRTSDILSRIGGDEFAVLTVKAHESVSEMLSARLRESLERYQAAPRRPFRVSVSVGIEKFGPGDRCSVEELLTRADHRMYANKRSKTKSPPA